MNVMNKPMYDNVVSSLKINQETRVLDIGYGYLIQKMYSKSKGSFYGIDISEDTLKSAQQRNRKGVLSGKIHLQLGDCCKIAYEDDFLMQLQQ